MSKSVSIEEVIARIEKDLEENEIAEEGVIRAAPTGPTTPLMPREHFEIGSLLDNGDFRPLTDNESTIRYEPLRRGPMNPCSPDNLNTFLSAEELIAILEQETEESFYQIYCEKYTQLTGEPPNTVISEIIKTRAFLDYAHGQRILRYLQNIPQSPLEMCPVEREQLDRYGELFEVAREEGESDEAYRERIRQRAYPHLT